MLLYNFISKTGCIDTIFLKSKIFWKTKGLKLWLEPIQPHITILVPPRLIIYIMQLSGYLSPWLLQILVLPSKHEMQLRLSSEKKTKMCWCRQLCWWVAQYSRSIRVMSIQSKLDCIITYWTLVNASCRTSIISWVDEPVLQMLSKDVVILTLCCYFKAIRTRTAINTVCNLENLRKCWCVQNAFATFWGRCPAFNVLLPVIFVVGSVLTSEMHQTNNDVTEKICTS